MDSNQAHAYVNGTDANFQQEVIEASKTMPVFVDYWADWCPPCKAIAPIVEKLAEDYKGKMKVVKVDIDANPGIPQQFVIRSIPTLMVFSHGELALRDVGSRPESAMKELFDKSIEEFNKKSVAA